MLHPHVVGNFTQRLWAYLTIKELLKKRLISDDTVEKEEFEERALNLSLKYHFVTPLTSLVVVKPDGSNDTTNEKTEENERIEADLTIPSSLMMTNKPYLRGRLPGNLQMGPTPHYFNPINPNQGGQPYRPPQGIQQGGYAVGYTFAPNAGSRVGNLLRPGGSQQGGYNVPYVDNSRVQPTFGPQPLMPIPGDLQTGGKR